MNAKKLQPKIILVVDVGGTNLKISTTGSRKIIKIPSGPTMTAARMAAAVRKAVVGIKYDAVAIGYPGPVVKNQPSLEPHNMARGWVKFDYKNAFGRPVKIINDAAMQALGDHRGGRMLFLGLGTGLGSALVVDGKVLPLELAHLPYKRGGSYEDYLGNAGLKRFGKKKWRRYVNDVVNRLKNALLADTVVLGGGNVRLMDEFPPGVRAGKNANAIRGGYRLWNAP
jgi:polyphosphate glucokinase